MNGGQRSERIKNGVRKQHEESSTAIVGQAADRQCHNGYYVSSGTRKIEEEDNIYNQNNYHAFSIARFTYSPQNQLCR